MEMATTVRRRRTMRLRPGAGADLGWQQGIRAFHEASGGYGYVEDSHLNRERMSFRVDMPEISEDMRPVQPKPTHRTTRHDNLERERQEELARVVDAADGRGVRASIALAAAVVLVLALLVCWTANSSRLSAVQRRIDRLDSRIAALDGEYKKGQADYEEAVAKVDVGYVAVSQGLISSKGAETIRLVIPEDATSTPAEIAGQTQVTASSRH